MVRTRALVVALAVAACLPDAVAAPGDSAELFQIVVAGKVGYIDRTGKVVIEPQQRRSGRFHDGLATVRVGRKWGFIDTTGAIAIEARFDYAGAFSGGHAPVEVADRWGLTDRHGDSTAEPRYERTSLRPGGAWSAASGQPLSGRRFGKRAALENAERGSPTLPS